MLKFAEEYPSIHESFLQGEFVVRLTQRNIIDIPIDQALESKYNKPAKGASGIIGITRRKAAVGKWNFIENEKSNYTNLLRQMSRFNNEDKYSLLHEFSKQRTESDLQCVKQLVAYVNERGNPFDGREIVIKNLVTGATSNEKSSPFILNCFSEEKLAYEKFRKEKLEIKSTKLFDTIPKRRSSFKKGKPWKAPDIKEETVNFLRTADYSRLRGFDVGYLLTHEIVATSYYLTKDGELRKSPKSEFARELKNLLEEPCPTNVPETSLNTAIIIDLMAYCSKGTN